MRFGEGVWVVCSGFVKVGSNLLQARRVRQEVGAQAGDEYDDVLKGVLIEDSGVGKSDPPDKFCVVSKSTICVDFGTRCIQVLSPLY